MFDMPQARAYQPKQLNAKHDEILRLKLLGMSNRSIGEELGVTEVTVGYVVNSELGKMKLREMQDLSDLETCDIAREIKKAAPKAVRLLRDIVEDRVEGASVQLRVRTAQDLLSRAGHSPIQKSQVQTDSYMDVVHSIKEKARAAGMLDPAECIDVVCEELEGE